MTRLELHALLIEASEALEVEAACLVESISIPGTDQLDTASEPETAASIEYLRDLSARLASAGRAVGCSPIVLH